MNDKQLQQNVLDELDFEPSIDAAQIGVAVDNGVITLSGHVPSLWQKTKAERTVWCVRGVKAIAQEIEVRFANDKKDADDQIAERAIKILAWDTRVPKGTVRVKIQHGWITLEGEVSWQHQRQAAEANVRKLIGVSGVTNNIELKQVVQAPDVRTCIEDALKRHAEVEADRIIIKVRDNSTVTLEGKVANWAERQAVERAAWSAAGVMMVEDCLAIG